MDTDSLLSQNWPPIPPVRWRSCSETDFATTEKHGRKKMEKNARNATEFLFSVDLGKVWPPLLPPASVAMRASVFTRKWAAQYRRQCYTTEIRVEIRSPRDMSRGQRISTRISTDSCSAVYCGWTATTRTRSLRAASCEPRTLPPAIATTCSSSSHNARVCSCARSSLYGFTAKRQALEGTHTRRVRLSWKGNITLWLLCYGSLPA